jgi:hypothetical protein
VLNSYLFIEYTEYKSVTHLVSIHNTPGQLVIDRTPDPLYNEYTVKLTHTYYYSIYTHIYETTV